MKKVLISYCDGGKPEIIYFDRKDLIKVTNNIRRQLTLFVDEKDARTIQLIRQKFDPLQFELIKAHVTLCREDEIQNLDQVIINLFSLKQNEFVIEFEKVTRFDNGKGVFLTATNNNGAFHELRKRTLFGLIDNLNKPEPHITLMHPRNSTCTTDLFTQIEKVSFPTKLKFRKISLIEQHDGGPWKILQEFE